MFYVISAWIAGHGAWECLYECATLADARNAAKRNASPGCASIIRTRCGAGTNEPPPRKGEVFLFNGRAVMSLGPCPLCTMVGNDACAVCKGSRVYMIGL